MYRSLAAQFEGRAVDKTYLAIVSGWPAGKPRAKLVHHLAPDEDVFLDLPGRAEHAPDVLLRVEEALSLMAKESPELAELLSQFYFAGYTIGEIGRFSGESEKTVDRKLKRARVLARVYFEKCPPS